MTHLVPLLLIKYHFGPSIFNLDIKVPHLFNLDQIKALLLTGVKFLTCFTISISRGYIFLLNVLQQLFLVIHTHIYIYIYLYVCITENEVEGIEYGSKDWYQEILRDEAVARLQHVVQVFLVIYYNSNIILIYLVWLVCVFHIVYNLHLFFFIFSIYCFFYFLC